MIVVGLSQKDPETILFTVKDNGVGIKDVDRPNMFKEGGRGKDATKINVHSSGYGLATAKNC
ncbi:MAG: ATP-binding protein [bacterium]|nr:ATP-binding protein [bacterium]